MELGTCRQPAYLQASFNGVAFQAMEASSEHGRRGAEGEFPFSNETGFVDMGRRIRTYSISARLADDDFQTRAAALIAACEIPGPGILVHPTRGVLNVSCRSLSVRDNVLEEQGVTYIDLEFVEANLWKNGLSLVGSLLGFVLRPILTASSNSFRSKYAIRSELTYLQPGSQAYARSVAQTFFSEYQRTQGPKPQVVHDLRLLASDPVMVDDVEIMDRMIRNGASAIATGSRSQSTKYEAFRRIANSVVSGRLTTKSDAALASHTRIVAGAYMAQTAIEMDYASTDAALVAMDQVSTTLDQEADAAYQGCDSQLFLVIREFADRFNEQIYSKAYGSPARVEFDFFGSVSPLVAAYSIWDDSTRSREISATNKSSHHGFVGPSVVAIP